MQSPLAVVFAALLLFASVSANLRSSEDVIQEEELKASEILAVESPDDSFPQFVPEFLRQQLQDAAFVESLLRQQVDRAEQRDFEQVIEDESSEIEKDKNEILDQLDQVDVLIDIFLDEKVGLVEEYFVKIEDNVDSFGELNLNLENDEEGEESGCHDDGADDFDNELDQSNEDVSPQLDEESWSLEQLPSRGGIAIRISESGEVDDEFFELERDDYDGEIDASLLEEETIDGCSNLPLEIQVRCLRAYQMELVRRNLEMSEMLMAFEEREKQREAEDRQDILVVNFEIAAEFEEFVEEAEIEKRAVTREKNEESQHSAPRHRSTYSTTRRVHTGTLIAFGIVILFSIVFCLHRACCSRDRRIIFDEEEDLGDAQKYEKVPVEPVHYIPASF